MSLRPALSQDPLHARTVAKVFSRLIRRFNQDARHEMLEKSLLIWLRHGPRYADRPNDPTERHIIRRLLELCYDRCNGSVNASLRRVSARHYNIEQNQGSSSEYPRDVVRNGWL